MKRITDDITCIKNMMLYHIIFDLSYFFRRFNQIWQLLILQRYTKQFKESLFASLMKNITDDIACIKNVMPSQFIFDLLYFFMHFDRIRQEAEEKTIKTWKIQKN